MVTKTDFVTKQQELGQNRFVSTFLMWRNFSTWQICLHIYHVETFRQLTICGMEIFSTWQSVMWRNFSTWQIFLHKHRLWCLWQIWVMVCEDIDIGIWYLLYMSTDIAPIKYLFLCLYLYSNKYVYFYICVLLSTVDIWYSDMAGRPLYRWSWSVCWPNTHKLSNNAWYFINLMKHYELSNDRSSLTVQGKCRQIIQSCAWCIWSNINSFSIDGYSLQIK